MRKKELEENIKFLTNRMNSIQAIQNGIIHFIETHFNVEMKPLYQNNSLQTLYAFIGKETKIRNIKDELDKQDKKIEKLETRFDNLDKLLEETILPYIASQLVKQLGEHFGEFANDLADLFESEKPKTAKNVEKDTEKPAKNVGKKTTKKKESK